MLHRCIHIYYVYYWIYAVLLSLTTILIYLHNNENCSEGIMFLQPIKFIGCFVLFLTTG